MDITVILEPFSFSFFSKAFFVGILIALSYSLVGSLIVARRETIITHTLSSFSLLGIVIFASLGLSLEAGVYIGALLGLLAVHLLERVGLSQKDAVLTFLAETALALSIILLAAFKVTKIDLSQFLFGNILGLSTSDLILVTIVTFLVFGLFCFQGRNLVKIILSPEIAQASGIRVGLLNFTYSLLVALVVAVGVRAIGGLLVSAMIVVPALTAKLLAKNFRNYQIIASMIAVFAVISGLYLSYFINIPTGPTIVVGMSVIYLLALVFRTK
ncbi:metal ABC transporter permease [Candidatus Gracilibacteria bacterium]|nr:metal ABC transporter permease [Candidatus Gracilibacteria bacterium]